MKATSVLKKPAIKKAKKDEEVEVEVVMKVTVKTKSTTPVYTVMDMAVAEAANKNGRCGYVPTRMAVDNPPWDAEAGASFEKQQIIADWRHAYS